MVIFLVEQFYTFCLLRSDIPARTSSQHLNVVVFFITLSTQAHS